MVATRSMSVPAARLCEKARTIEDTTAAAANTPSKPADGMKISRQIKAMPVSNSATGHMSDSMTHSTFI
jgi:hypothetical protein